MTAAIKLVFEGGSIEVDGSLEVLQLQPDDVVVITLPGDVPYDAVKRMAEAGEELFDGHKVAICIRGATIERHGSEWAMEHFGR